MKHTGGTWDRDHWPVYFIATNPEQLEISTHDHVLMAVNEIENDPDLKAFERILDQQDKVFFLDSGVFNLATTHATRHNISMDQALQTAPDEIDGFKELFDRYVEIAKTREKRLWGYVEIDQGGRANKIKTRERLEKLGLRPIPVYHPLNDGWDYFDYLAKNYDRICFGNVVNAPINVRKRLVATAWERRRKYPHLWIHLLGLTPSPLTLAYPANSCDSSTWIGSLRWARMVSWAATGAFDGLGLEFAYDYEHSKTADDYDHKQTKNWNASYIKALKMCSYDAAMTGREMQSIAHYAETELGCDIGMFGRKTK